MYFFPGGVCDFQQDLCSYTQDKTDDFDWTRLKGKTPTSGTGPLTDHTLGTGLGKIGYSARSSKNKIYI